MYTISGHAAAEVRSIVGALNFAPRVRRRERWLGPRNSHGRTGAARTESAVLEQRFCSPPSGQQHEFAPCRCRQFIVEHAQMLPDRGLGASLDGGGESRERR